MLNNTNGSTFGAGRSIDFSELKEDNRTTHLKTENWLIQELIY